MGTPVPVTMLSLRLSPYALALPSARRLEVPFTDIADLSWLMWLDSQMAGLQV